MMTSVQKTANQTKIYYHQNWDNLVAHLQKAGNRSWIVLMDQKLADLYPQEMASICQALNPIYIESLEAGESLKSFAKFEDLINKILSHRPQRDTMVVAIGGGSLTDFAGFIASVLLRGVEWVAVPSTLLAMSDAAIGGKVGINTSHGKNTVGQFHFPNDVCIYPAFINSLPPEELHSGLGEVLKYAFLDSQICQAIEENLDLGLIIELCAQLKNRFVQDDPMEKGKRALLNLGHTLGHAFEKVYSIPHGVAVYWGLYYLLKIEGRPDLVEKLVQLKNCLGLDLQPLEIEKNDLDSLIEYVKVDKKRSGKGQITLAIPYAIGDVRLEISSMNKFLERMVSVI